MTLVVIIIVACAAGIGGCIGFAGAPKGMGPCYAIGGAILGVLVIGLVILLIAACLGGSAG